MDGHARETVGQAARTPPSLRANGEPFVSGLRLQPGLTFSDWVGMGRCLTEFSRASAWWLGDWLLYGECAYGQRYKMAVGVTSLDYQTLRNYAWVARSFELSRRRDSLSFQHHAVVAGLSEAEQDLWLQRAERAGWTRSELRRRLAASRRMRPADAEGEAVVMRMSVPRHRQRRWLEAAVAQEQELSDWIARAADEAAESLLEDRSAPSRRLP